MIKQLVDYLWGLGVRPAIFFLGLAAVQVALIVSMRRYLRKWRTTSFYVKGWLIIYIFGLYIFLLFAMEELIQPPEIVLYLLGSIGILFGIILIVVVMFHFVKVDLSSFVKYMIRKGSRRKDL